MGAPNKQLMRVEALQTLVPRQQKAQLQTILKAATIYKDGRIELEFRGEILKDGAPTRTEEGVL